MNNEINLPDRPRRGSIINELLNAKFNPQQTASLGSAFPLNDIDKANTTKSFFARRYLLAMLLREFKRNNLGENFDVTPEQRFNILMAYLQIIDEEHDADKKLTAIFSLPKDSLTEYRMLWCFFIEQFEFNQDVDAVFELIKLHCYSKYCFDNLRPYLKEYLDKHEFKNLNQFLASYRQVASTTVHYRKEDGFTTLEFIDPLSAVNKEHLKSLTINHLLGKDILETIHLRKFPVYETLRKDFMVIDQDMCRKKIFRGPFFEIFFETSLKTKKKFEDHCSDIANGAMEKICFRAICTLLRRSKHDVFHFDDNSQSLPDLYTRDNKKVIFIEYKDYIFREKLITKADFEEIKNYIYERFVFSDKKKPKGVTQLANQIESFCQRQFEFDPVVNTMLERGKTIIIYPIICYSDFMFSMPGVNQYIDEIFRDQLSKKQLPNLVIKPVTMINIEKMFDYCTRRRNLFLLTDLIDRYWKTLESRQKRFNEEFSHNGFLRKHASFDEIYQEIYLKDFLKKRPDIELFKILPDLIGLTQEQMNEDL